MSPHFWYLVNLMKGIFLLTQNTGAYYWALERQSQISGCSVDGVNQTLINLNDTRYMYASSYSRAILVKGESWAAEVNSYLRKHNMEKYLDKIANRVDD